MSQPIFIVGANRSGTTLLRLMLNAHPRLAIPDEVSYFRGRHHLEDGRWRTVTTDGWFPPFGPHVRQFLQRNAEVLAPLDVDAVETRILATPEDERDWRLPYETALSAWASMHGKARWGEKTPGNLFFADVLIEMFPDAQFIYLVRDPRAGVHSMMKTDFFRAGAVVNALNRHKYLAAGYDHLCRHVPEAQRTVVRFEDLVHQPDVTLQGLCDFLGEPYLPEMLAFHRNAEQFMKPSAAEGYNSAATRPVTPRTAEAWRTNLTPLEVAEIEWICSADMDRFGYEREAPPLPVWHRLAAVWKRAYWQVQCLRHRNSPQFIQQDRPFTRSRKRLHDLIPSGSP